ncbi:uncharacterized protein N7484_006721 [Penicillium longicatenatum]|uniref:uncharacterized protein n=1 Tax=Penicillium longicatenatum TaxID=1561947 RepID=UPI0025485B63|nr:uncharacterized protein N7484_006721 [Penicillium longicatenatum]KAJ5644214.1 hypothetical protein N7484_006721 [Penicillium longicatenatum]
MSLATDWKVCLDGSAPNAGDRENNPPATARRANGEDAKHYRNQISEKKDIDHRKNLSFSLVNFNG